MDQIPYRLPLVIGATGHRDLRDQDIPALEDQVAEAIKRLKRDYIRRDCRLCSVKPLYHLLRWLGCCHGEETPIIVLSSLAEGADRVIARVALAQGATLIAPLPLPAEQYRHDFAPDSVAEFERLKDRAIVVPVMPFVRDNSPDNVGEKSRRAEQYREAGLFVVRHCHVLIALWDGDERDPAIGGTAEVVGFKRDGIPLDVAGSVRASLDAPEMGPVIHILTPRAEPPGEVNKVETRPWGVDFARRYRGRTVRRMWNSIIQFMDGAFGIGGVEDRLPTCARERRAFQSWDAFETKSALTCRFNREAAALDPPSAPGEILVKSLKDLFDESELEPPVDGAKECAANLIPHWCSLYKLADTLAKERHNRFIFDWWTLFGLGFLAIASFEVGTHLLFDSAWLFLMLVLYGVFFIVIFGLFVYARRKQHQERFLDYRALAEALRAAVFWKLVGIGWSSDGTTESSVRSTVDLSSRNAISNAYPIRQPSELDWVKTCLRTLELLDSGKSLAELKHPIDTKGENWARTFWVRRQLAFFRDRSPKHDRHAEKLENRSLFLVIVSLVFAVALGVFDWTVLDRRAHGEIYGIPWGHEHCVHRIVILLIGLFPGLAAVWTGYSERLALKAQARQYDRMRVVFERANDLLQTPERADFARIQVLYAELGAEAMAEHAEWVAIYRQRPIRPP
jgi:hypothetical protein